MPLVQIAYASASIRPFTKEDLIDLLRKSRAKNQKIGVTGLLLYKSGNFLQILEGESSVIKTILSTIEADPRHKELITLFKRNITEREFPDWSMGFQNLNDPDVEQLPGYSKFLDLSFEPKSLDKESSQVRALIHTFAMVEA